MTDVGWPVTIAPDGRRLAFVRNILNNCFFFNDTATTEIYTLSLHDALPISISGWMYRSLYENKPYDRFVHELISPVPRSEEHTSELQSRGHLVCRLLLEKKKKNRIAAIVCYKPKNPKNKID